MWEGVKHLLNKKFNSTPGYCDNVDTYIKTKIKKMLIMLNTNFQSTKFPKEKTSCKCLSSMMKDFVVKEKKNDHPQTLLDEWKYEKNKMEKFITDDLEASSSDNETDFDSDDDENKSENKKDNDESNE